jgi:hypothetical protein
LDVTFEEDIMKRIVALVLTAMLVGTGCAQRSVSLAAQASARPHTSGTRLSTVQREPEDWHRYLGNLPAGTKLTIDLADGARVTGIILGVEQDVLVLQPKTRLPTPVRRIPFDAIVALAPESSGGGINVGNAIAIGAVTGAVSFIAIFLLLWGLGD